MDHLDEFTSAKVNTTHHQVHTQMKMKEQQIAKSSVKRRKSRQATATGLQDDTELH